METGGWRGRKGARGSRLRSRSVVVGCAARDLTSTRANREHTRRRARRGELYERRAVPPAASLTVRYGGAARLGSARTALRLFAFRKCALSSSQDTSVSRAPRGEFLPPFASSLAQVSKTERRSTEARTERELFEGRAQCALRVASLRPRPDSTNSSSLGRHTSRVCLTTRAKRCLLLPPRPPLPGPRGGQPSASTAARRISYFSVSSTSLKSRDVILAFL